MCTYCVAWCPHGHAVELLFFRQAQKKEAWEQNSAYPNRWAFALPCNEDKQYRSPRWKEHRTNNLTVVV